VKLLPDTLASRVTLWHSTALVIFFSIAFPAFYLTIDTVVQRQIDEDLIEDIAEFHDLWRTGGIDQVKEEIESEIASESPAHLFIRLLDRSGGTLYATDMSHWGHLPPNQETIHAVGNGNEPELESRLRSDDEEFRSVYGTIAPGTIMQIGETIEEQREFMDLLLGLFFATYLIILPLSALIGWSVTKKSLSGIEEVSLAAEAIANGNLNRHVSVCPRGTEIERLVDTFNSMVDRVHALITEMHEMMDNIAHDMKTPLARIRTSSELALTGSVSVETLQSSTAVTLEECDRLLEMINTTLDVSEAEAGAAHLRQERVNVSSLISEACELFKPVAEEKGIRLCAQTSSDCQVKGNVQHLQRMLANMIDNGIKFTDPDGDGEIMISLELEDNWIKIVVRDSGIGIAMADQSKIFDRFVRGDQSRNRPGSGLGLSFARAVAHSHGGNIQVASKPGKGSIFTIILPAVQCG